MPQSPQINVRINEIAKELANGVRREDIITKYCKKFQKGARQVDNYIELAKPIAIELSKRANKAAEDIMLSEVGEAVKKGLKSKFERIMILQDEIDKCLHELYGEGVDNYADFGGSRKNVKKQLTVFEKVKLRQTINMLQSEISKIEGDYAPEKGILTHRFGKDKQEEYED